MDKHYKVSFCITCKGRLSHLQETLPHNLKNNADYPDTEFVILDYDSQDGLEKWVKDNFHAEIASGKIRYGKYAPAPHFKTSHAKNMAHRLATGEIVCNLDADNITAPGFAAWLNKEFSKEPDSYLSSNKRTFLHRRLSAKPPKGITGRIAILRKHFDALRGYDESFRGWGGEDDNFTLRAHMSGLRQLHYPQEMFGQVIQHSDTMRIEHFPADDIEGSRLRLTLSHHPTLVHKITSPWIWRSRLGMYQTPAPANLDGNFGCGKVRVNFGDEISLEPCAAVEIIKKTDNPRPMPDRVKARHGQAL